MSRFFNNIFGKDFKSKFNLVKIMKNILIGFLISLLLTILYYTIFSLIIDTDIEAKLKTENKLYEKVYPQMKENEELLDDVIIGLHLSDNYLYKSLFDSDPPTLDRTLNNKVGYLDDALLLENSTESNNSKKVRGIEDRAASVEENLRVVLEKCIAKPDSLPPLLCPLKDIDASKIGASIGSKLNPFYKVKVEHDGLDIIAPINTPIYASADGYVFDIKRSKGGQGYMITIKHNDGYMTKYAHLKRIDVIKYRRVERGQQIGTVGVTGKTFAPHLHYEVLKDDLVLDPINYMFASISPKEYVEYLYMSMSIGQSMD